MKPVWYNLKDVRPEKSGFYLYQFNPDVSCSIFYYCKELDYVMDIDCGEYLVGNPVNNCTRLFWAKMPKINQSKFLSNGYLKITM